MAEEDPKEKADRERIFKHFDTNGDGKISADELGDALKALGCVSTEEVKFMMEEIDTDSDGFISYEEYISFALAFLFQCICSWHGSFSLGFCK